MAGNRGNYPLCNVAQYLTFFRQPGRPGTTYLFGHARAGMMLSMLEASRRNNGAEMLGDSVRVYRSDGWLFVYQIFRVKRHATDFSLANSLAPGEQRVILQTSEGPSGTVPKLQVAARLVETRRAGIGESNPTPRPRPC